MTNNGSGLLNKMFSKCKNKEFFCDIIKKHKNFILFSKQKSFLTNRENAIY